MRREEEEETPPPEPGLGVRVAGWISRVDRALAAWLMAVIDALISPLQGLKNRIAPADEEEEDVRDRRHKPLAHARLDEELVTTAPTKPRRLRSFLFIVLALVVGALSGMWFSYDQLSKTLSADNAIIGYMQDEIHQLEKSEKRNLNARAKLQEQVDAITAELKENRAEIRDYQDQIEAYKIQNDNLTRQLNAHNDTSGRYSSSPLRRPVPDYAARRPTTRQAPEKTGNCVTGGASTAADLARCVEEFNRK